MKILISAYSCSPYRGSEPGVGWGFVSALAHEHNLTVITESSFKDDIERFQNENLDFPKVDFRYLPRTRNRAAEKLWPPSYYWTYQQWHKKAFDLARLLHHEVGFDLAHQLTMVGFREPGYLWKLGIPFVWGPVGGMGIFPWRFLPAVGIYGALYYLSYNMLNTWQMRISSRPKIAAKIAGKGLITATPENQVGAEKYWGCSSEIINEVGLPPAPVMEPTSRKADEPLRLVWTGLHIPRKALNLALAALARLPRELNWELHVLGKGPQTSHWQQLAQQFGLTEHSHFYGWLPRNEAMEVMAGSHLMLITSLRDLTSTVTIEALSLGLPIVCLDHCGFSGVVDDTCGIKVPVTQPSDTIHGLAEAIKRLAGDEYLRHSMAEGAVRRAQEFSWENKAEVLNRIYREVIAEAKRPTS